MPAIVQHTGTVPTSSNQLPQFVTSVAVTVAAAALLLINGVFSLPVIAVSFTACTIGLICIFYGNKIRHLLSGACAQGSNNIPPAKSPFNAQIFTTMPVQPTTQAEASAAPAPRPMGTIPVTPAVPSLAPPPAAAPAAPDNGAIPAAVPSLELPAAVPAAPDNGAIPLEVQSLIPQQAADPSLASPPAAASLELPQEAAAPSLEPSPAEASVAPDNGAMPASASLPSARRIIDIYAHCWSETEQQSVDQNDCSIAVPTEILKATILAHNQQFQPTLNLDNAYGFIEKKDFDAETRIAVMTDVHGDLKTLLKFLQDWQEQGLLDENYKCRENVQLVFLGDYTDRGLYSAQVLELLLTLHMENPDQVTLIRGNHENVTMNTQYANPEDYSFRDFVNNPDNELLLQDLHNTMPLTVYMSENSDERGVRQYRQFTHGLFELYVDPADMLDSADPRAKMAVSKVRRFSDRILTILRSIELDPVHDYEDQLASTPKDEDHKILRKQLKQKIAAQKIKALREREEGLLDHFGVSETRPTLTAYNWGDMAMEGWESHPGVLGQRDNNGWYLRCDDVKYYLQLCGNKNKVKMVTRGHQHGKEFYEWPPNSGKRIVDTLPVAMDADTGYQLRFPGQDSTAYVLETAVKVKNWTKISCTLSPAESQVQRTDRIPVCAITQHHNRGPVLPTTEALPVRAEWAPSCQPYPVPIVAGGPAAPPPDAPFLG